MAPWWLHQKETFSALLAICAGNSLVTGEFPTQRPVTRSFDVFFGLRLNKRLSKQSWGWWFETPSRPLWRHCNAKSRAQNTSQFWNTARNIWRQTISLVRNKISVTLFAILWTCCNVINHVLDGVQFPFSIKPDQYEICVCVINDYNKLSRVMPACVMISMG